MEQQEQILGELNTQLGQTSLSERTIREYVGANLPEDGQEFDYAKHVAILRSLNGNFSADMKRAVEDFKKNYKPQPIEEKNDKKDDAPEPSGEIAKLLSRIEALEKGNEESSKAVRKSQIRSEVEAKMDSLKVHNKNLWKDCVREVSINDTDSQEKVLEKVKSAYEKKLKDYFGEGAAPYGGKSAEQSQSEKDALIEKRNAAKAKLKSQGKL